MSGNSKTVATIVLLILVSLLGIRAQAQETANGSQRKTVVFLDSTKEQEGLSGAVRRMRVESAKLELKSGKLTEGLRQLVEVTAYDVNGKRIENVSYPFAASPTGKEEYKYDTSGNVVEMTLRRDDGSILSKERYEYEYDRVGNWTKMMTSLVVFEGGELKLEPVEVTYRSFSYYFNDTVQKILNTRSSPRSSDFAPSPTSAAVVQPVKVGESAEHSKNAQPMIIVPAAENSLPAFNAKNQKISSTETIQASEEATAKAINKSAAASPGDSQSKVNSLPSEVPSITPATAATNKDLGAETGSQPKEVNTRFLLASSESDDHSRSASTTQPSGERVDHANSLPSEPAKNVSNGSPILPVTLVNSGSEEQPKGLPIVAADKAIDPLSTAEAPAASQSALALYAIGRNRFDSGDFKGAVDAYNESIKLQPESAEYQLSLAHAYMQLKQNGDAIKALKQAIRLNPDAIEAHYGLGLLYFKVGRYTDAMMAFKQTVKLDPNLAKAHYGLAMTYSELRNNDGLLREYKILQKLDPVLARKVSETFPDFTLLPCRVPPFCSK